MANYFWRLYSFELFENYVQLYNMITMYLCMLPLSWCIVFSLILIYESLIRVYIMSKKIWCSKNQNITVVEKDFQLALDICIDLFFLVAPITVTYLGYMSMAVNCGDSLDAYISIHISVQ